MNKYKFLGGILHFIYRFLSFLTRKEYFYADGVQMNNPNIIVFWHRKIFTVCNATRIVKKKASMVSASKDGEILSEVLRREGNELIRGSSNKDNIKSLKEAMKYAKKKYGLGIAIDGPNGPIFEPKSGAIFIAQRTGMPIVPVSSYCSRKWIFKKMWDKLEIPMPFAKCVHYIAEPFYLSKETSLEESTELVKKRIHDAGYKAFEIYEKKYNNYFIVDNERRNGEIFEMNSSNIFGTMTYDSENYKPKKTPFNFFNRHPIVSFVIIELLKEENYLFKDFSKEMKQILNKGMNINVFFKYFKIRGEINELKEIDSKKEYFVKFLEEQKWNKYRNKIPFALNLILFRAPKLINENVLRETVEREDRIIKNFITNFKKIGEGRFALQYLFGIIFLLERIEINSESIPKAITLMQDTFSMAQELEIQIDLTKINSEKALRKKHNKFLKEINLRARLREKEKLETVFAFPEKFNPVIENLGAEYELIKDGKRLLEEGEEQHNCVFSYFKNITEGKCLIYSLLTETEKSSENISDNSDKERKRYTIEIIEKNGKFEVVQFLGKFNKKDAKTVKLEVELREKLKKIGTINI